LIDPLLERYGWTYDYALWGISLVNVQMLMADIIDDITDYSTNTGSSNEEPMIDKEDKSPSNFSDFLNIMHNIKK